MHDSALYYAEKFFKIYCAGTLNSDFKIVDIGSLDVNGSLREVAPKNINYHGLDFTDGKGVDNVLDDPYKLPLPNNCADIVVSSSCFEHSEFFWLTFLEISRILKPSGFIYLNAPSNGMYHKYPIDSWRFYPDSGKSLANWAQRNNHKIQLVESFIGDRSKENVWNDFVAIFQKSPLTRDRNSSTIAASVNGITNAHTNSGFLFHKEHSSDFTELRILEKEVARLKKEAKINMN